MSVTAVGTVRSCGATTVALGLAATWPSDRRVLLIEADPAGGTLAASAGFPAEPSLVSLAAAVRRTDAVELAITHTHRLPNGAPALTAPATAEQSERALALLTRLFAHVGELDIDVLLDCGRLTPITDAAPAGTDRVARTNTDRLLAADRAILVARPQLPDLHALGGFFDHPRLATARNDGRLSLVLVGNGPYSDAEIAEVLGVPVIARLPLEPDTAVALATTAADARELRRTPLVRELRSLSALLAPPSADVPDPAPLEEIASTDRSRGRFRSLVRVATDHPHRANGVHANGTSGAAR